MIYPANSGNVCKMHDDSQPLPVSRSSRRKFLLAAALFARIGPGIAATSHVGLERPRSLIPLLAIAARDARPVVAMFSLPGCPWCERLRREQLFGLSRQPAGRGIQLVEFDMRDDTRFEKTANAGHATHSSGEYDSVRSAAELSRHLNIRIAPTVVFLGPEGEIAERLIGYTSPDFYGAYLDDRITQAKARLAVKR